MFCHCNIIAVIEPFAKLAIAYHSRYLRQYRFGFLINTKTLKNLPFDKPQDVVESAKNEKCRLESTIHTLFILDLMLGC